MSVTVNISREELLAAINRNAPAPRPLSQPAAPAQEAPSFRRGSGTPARTTKPEPAWRSEPVSPPQVDGLRKRLAARKDIPEAEAIRTEVNALTDNGTHIERLTKGQASDFITRLDAIKPNVVATPVPNAPGTPQSPSTDPAKADDAWKRPNCVPDGQYALRGEDGVVKFYTVRTPDEGKWAGTCFVDVHASDERYPVKGHARHQVLDALQADPRAAAVLYGKETNHCSRCGRELTDEVSRANGIGPVCARKAGW